MESTESVERHRRHGRGSLRALLLSSLFRASDYRRCFFFTGTVFFLAAAFFFASAFFLAASSFLVGFFLAESCFLAFFSSAF